MFGRLGAFYLPRQGGSVPLAVSSRPDSASGRPLEEFAMFVRLGGVVAALMLAVAVVLWAFG